MVEQESCRFYFILTKNTNKGFLVSGMFLGSSMLLSRLLGLLGSSMLLWNMLLLLGRRLGERVTANTFSFAFVTSRVTNTNSRCLLWRGLLFGGGRSSSLFTRFFGGLLGSLLGGLFTSLFSGGLFGGGLFTALNANVT